MKVNSEHIAEAAAGLVILLFVFIMGIYAGWILWGEEPDYLDENEVKIGLCFEEELGGKAEIDEGTFKDHSTIRWVKYSSLSFDKETLKITGNARTKRLEYNENGHFEGPIRLIEKVQHCTE